MATMTTHQQLVGTIAPMKADGTPGTVQAGSVVVAGSDDTVLTAKLEADGTVTVSAVAEGGPARFTVTADADLGAGVLTITGVSEDITVTLDPRDAASTFTITLGAPVDKP